MAVELKILGWSADGLRCPDHTVSFVDKDGKLNKITLMQMPNGTGKTTTLKLLRAALAGPEIWTPEHDKPVNFRKNKTVKKGKFELRLLYNGNKRLTIILEFDFTTDGPPQYITIGPPGKELRFDPPPSLQSILKPDFVSLLVFDGELASNLLDANHTNAQNAIEEIYQLSYLRHMRARIDEHWMATSEDEQASGSSKQYNRRKNKVDGLKDRIKEVRKCRREDAATLEKIEDQLKQLERKFQKELKNHSKEEQELRETTDELNQAIHNVADIARQAVTLMKNPAELTADFSNAILTLKNSLDNARLPGIAAREFFVEIAEQPSCICGRPIDKSTQKAIREGAQKYLGSEEVAVLNAMKSDIKDRVDIKEGVNPGEQLKRIMKSLQKAQHAEIQARQKLDSITETVSDHDPEMKKLSEKIKNLGQEKGGLTKVMERYTDTEDESDNSWNESILQKRLKEAEDDLAGATKTIELKEKRDILCRILDAAFEKSRKSLSETVCRETNKKINELMPHNHIQVASIDQCLRLADKEGGSVGETLAVGYAFLSSLLSNASHKLPAVVDSPSGPIDLQIRPEIAKLIPQLGEQFIAFTISSEREGFISPLVRAAKTDVHFFTLFRKGNTDLEKAARSTKQYVETGDGLLVAGQTYFENFHSDKED